MDDFDDDFLMMINSSAPEISEETTFVQEEHIAYLQRLNIINIVYLVLGILGNSLVCGHILRNSSLRKRQALFLNLCIANLLDTVSTHLFMIIYSLYKFRWLAGNAFCKIFVCMQLVIDSSSMYAVMAIVFEQLVVQVTPTWPKPPTRKIILWAWLLALIPSLPHLYTARVVEILPKLDVCSPIGNIKPSMQTFQIHMSIYFTAIFYLPFFIGCVMYLIIFLKAKPWNCVTTKKWFYLSLAIYGFAFFTGLALLTERNVLFFSDFQNSTDQIDTVLLFLFYTRNVVNPYIYISFNFRDIFQKKIPEHTCTDSVPLVIPSPEEAESTN